MTQRCLRWQERRRLESSTVSQLNHEKFGAKSEKLHPDQYHLPLEDVEIAQGVLDARNTALGRKRVREAAKPADQQAAWPHRKSSYSPPRARARANHAAFVVCARLNDVNPGAYLAETTPSSTATPRARSRISCTGDSGKRQAHIRRRSVRRLRRTDISR
ncbi:transposase [Mesorhizobium tamadayense]|uniref:transposase n=1 Tax=Mesorhizobium tamadayense TaxID=425306 RepID=UPI001FE20AA7|nr:transposase [Mesorhizobium tamadayense]